MYFFQLKDNKGEEALRLITGRVTFEDATPLID